MLFSSKMQIIHFSKSVWPNVRCYFWIAQQDRNGYDAEYFETLLLSELNMKLYVQISFNLKSPFEIFSRHMKISIRYMYPAGDIDKISRRLKWYHSLIRMMKWYWAKTRIIRTISSFSRVIPLYNTWALCPKFTYSE